MSSSHDSQSRCLAVEDMLDGSYLERLAAEHLASFNDYDQFQSLTEATETMGAGPNKIIRWATICSGSEVLVFAINAMQKAYRAAGFTGTFVHCFSCEISKAVQSWILAMLKETSTATRDADLGERPDPQACLFKDAEAIGNEYAYCVKRGQQCKVRTLSRFAHRRYQLQGLQQVG